ncbi:FAD-dependent oxidoreductase [Tessaracoccus sp. SD287]|uniref:dihydrolipoyl dehydrogenase family protein n=1 Tax=Tessaracoccus sp. SD287 TaxID=2782008 RepID=UPI001A976EDE|nr:FAD-dependent oxidoreductase [Tessaracoccus sp. SD287]MBO1029984.1 FAD-dependent oxidoreductase [Tessaracoccus sp. SD287]
MTEQLVADLLVIGWGKGGKTLAAARARLGDRVVIVEQSDQMYGGTCINVGCVPSKALVHQAGARRGSDDADAWYEQAITTVQTLTSAMRQKNFTMLDTLDTVTVVTGRARFLDATSVEVAAGKDRLLVSARTIIINTGAVAAVAPITGLRESSRLVTNVELLRTVELPRRLVVIGGGYVGLEFAASYRALGSQVTVLEAGPFLPGEDERVSSAVREVLADDGVTIVTGASVTRVNDGADSSVVSYVLDGTAVDVDADLVLAATGRRPATDDLGLDRAGIELGSRGEVLVNEFLQTSQPHVYAMGDVNGGPQFTYISLDDFRVVQAHRWGNQARSTLDRVAIPQVTFVTPPLASVGMTERAAIEAGHDVLVADKQVADMAMMPRAKIVGEPRGFMRFVVDRVTRQVLGATLMCVDSQEVINLVALAMRHQVTVDELRDAVYTHPSISEGLNDVLGAL